MAKQKTSDYNSIFATNLRGLLRNHPRTGERTTYMNLGKVLGVKPQSISQWSTGDTTPDMRHIVSIANFFGVDCNFLLTGVSAENQTVWEDLGLHENSVKFLMGLKAKADNHEYMASSMLIIVDTFLRSGALTEFYAMLNHYVYDTIDNKRAVKKLEHMLETKGEEAKKNNDSDTFFRIVDKLERTNLDSDYIWFKSVSRTMNVVNSIIETCGGIFSSAEVLFNNRGRLIGRDPELDKMFDNDERGVYNAGDITFGTDDADIKALADFEMKEKRQLGRPRKHGNLVLLDR
ncbi:hypothetical protein FACS1894120_5530 [Clostridia bacterium]|nr:hypothetical protein FACS1894120_5530 [Clostridia bacterium]